MSYLLRCRIYDYCPRSSISLYLPRLIIHFRYHTAHTKINLSHLTSSIILWQMNNPTYHKIYPISKQVGWTCREGGGHNQSVVLRYQTYPFLLYSKITSNIYMQIEITSSVLFGDVMIQNEIFWTIGEQTYLVYQPIISYRKIQVYRDKTMDMGRSHWNNGVRETILLEQWCQQKIQSW